jgi:hypothetical protein
LQLFFPSWTHKPGFLTSILFSTLNKDLRKPIWEAGLGQRGLFSTGGARTIVVSSGFGGLSLAQSGGLNQQGFGESDGFCC